MNKVALVGCGNLGSRHLQALALSNIPIGIEIVEPNMVSVKVAKERLASMPQNPNIKEVRFLSDMNFLSRDIEIAIVATSAKPRKEIVKWLSAETNVKYLILEKVVFQKPADFDEINKILEEKNIKAWVNCPRRMFSFYREQKNRVHKAQKINMIVDGGEWGLGSNSIHMFDLFAYLCGEETYKVTALHLDAPKKSKRDGYVELTGQISVNCSKGDLIISAIKDSKKPISIYIATDDSNYVIHEAEGKAWIAGGNSQWKWNEVPFDMQYQSVLTNRVIQDVIATGNCDLTEFGESMVYHKIILQAFIDRLNIGKNKMEEVDICPIT